MPAPSIIDFLMRNSDKERAQQILDANAKVPFVKRVLAPELYPRLDLGDGNYATHMMAWGQHGKDYVVFPTVQFDPKKNALIQLDPKDAFNHAVEKNDLIRFKSPDEAEWFSQNYKRVWDR